MVAWIAGVGFLTTVLFWLWVAVALVWRDRPPVIYDERLGRYRSARITKQQRTRR